MSTVIKDIQSAEVQASQATRPGGYDPSIKQKAAAKLSRIPVKVVQGEVLKKPDWIRVRAGSPSTRFYEIKDILRANKLVTVEKRQSVGDLPGKFEGCGNG